MFDDVYCRWGKQSSWETNHIATDFAWKSITEPVMRSYTEATDGSYIETKDSAMVWHYSDADPDFGSWQAKELLDHLESVLASEPVVVKKGHNIVEVKPQVSLSISLTHTLSFFILTYDCSQKVLTLDHQHNRGLQKG